MEAWIMSRGDERLRQLQRLADQGDPAAMAALRQEQLRLGKAPPWVKWAGITMTALHNVNDNYLNLWHIARVYSNAPASPYSGVMSTLDGNVLRAFPLDGADVVFLQQPDDDDDPVIEDVYLAACLPGPYVLVYFGANRDLCAVYAQRYDMRRWMRWRDADSIDDRHQSATMVEGYVNDPLNWRELHSLGTRHYWKMNPPRGDEHRRQLERRARQGDMEAQRALEAEQLRTGISTDQLVNMLTLAMVSAANDEGVELHDDLFVLRQAIRHAQRCASYVVRDGNARCSFVQQLHGPEWGGQYIPLGNFYVVLDATDSAMRIGFGGLSFMQQNGMHDPWEGLVHFVETDPRTVLALNV